LPDAPAYAAVDLGAESGRVVLGRLDGERVDLEVVHRFANRPVRLPDGLRWNLLALFAGTWLVNLVTSVLQSSSPASLLPSTALPVRLVKLTRDYGFVILVAGAIVTIRPQWTIGLVLALTVLNGSYLLAALLRPPDSR